MGEAWWRGFDVKTKSLPWVTGLVSIGNICVTCHKSLPNHGTAEFHKLLLETEAVGHGNNVVLTLKLCPQTSFMPYSTDNVDNRSKGDCFGALMAFYHFLWFTTKQLNLSPFYDTVVGTNIHVHIHHSYKIQINNSDKHYQQNLMVLRVLT